MGEQIIWTPESVDKTVHRPTGVSITHDEQDNWVVRCPTQDGTVHLGSWTNPYAASAYAERVIARKVLLWLGEDHAAALEENERRSAAAQGDDIDALVQRIVRRAQYDALRLAYRELKQYGPAITIELQGAAAELGVPDPTR